MTEVTEETEETTPDVDSGVVTAHGLIRSDVDGGRARRLAVWALEIWVLCAFAVAQPLFSLLGENATFFVAHRTPVSGIIWFVVVLVVVVPAALFAVDLVVEALEAAVSYIRHRRSVPPRVSPVVHVVILGSLLAVTIVPPLARATGLGSGPWLVLAVILAAGAVYLLARFEPLRRMVRYAAFAPPLFVVMFLFMSPVSSLVRGTPLASEEATTGLTDSDTPPVVWMVLDEFALSIVVGPDGQIVADRYPNLARLAEMSNWYPNYTAGAVFTERAVPAMLTGRWPSAGQLPVAADQPNSLFTVLDSADYPVQAYEFLTHMCPTTICVDETDTGSMPITGDVWAVYVRHLLPPGIADRYVGRIDQNWTGFGRTGDGPAGNTATGDSGEPAIDPDSIDPDDVEARWALLASLPDDHGGNVNLFDQFVDPLDEPDVSGLHYIHMRIPHGPLRYVPDGGVYLPDYEPNPSKEGQWPDSEPAMRTVVQRTIAQAMYADLMVGRMLDSLEESGNLDRTAIVVASDHGGSWRAGTFVRSMADPNSAADSVPSVLFIKGPGQTTGKVDDRRAQQVDILPTLLELIGIDPYGDSVPSGWKLDGLAMTPRHDEEWVDRKVIKLTDDGPVDYPDPPNVVDSPTVAWIDSILPDHANPYRIGPVGSVVGQAAGDQVRPESNYGVVLDGPNAFKNYTSTVPEPDDPWAKFEPVVVTGFIDGTDDPVHVAVVVNGRVVGVGESFFDDGDHRLAILIDPDAVQRERMDVSYLTTPVDGASTDLTRWSTLPIRNAS